MSSNLIEKQSQMVQELKAVEKDKTLLPGNVETVKQFEYEKVIPKLLREKPEPFETNRLSTFNIVRETECDPVTDPRDKITAGNGEQLALFDDKFLSL